MPHDTMTRDQVIRRAQDETHKRSFVIERAEGDGADSRSIEMAFASDSPCEHFSYRLWDFIDVKLSMDQKAMRTERLTSGAALLADHDPRDQIGVVDSFSVDAKDGKARAKVRFSKSARGQEIYQDVVDGIRRNVSVGFSIHKLVLEEENEDGNDLYRADDWEPFELSIVSIPADISVGVGRNAEFLNTNPQLELKQMSKEIETPETPVNGQETEIVERNAAEIKQIRNDQEIIEWAEAVGGSGKGELARQMLLASKDITLDDVRAKINEERIREKEIAKRVSPVKPVDGVSQTLSGALGRSEEYQSIVAGERQKRSIYVETNIAPRDYFRAAYSGSTDGLTDYQRLPGIVEIGQQQPTIADLFMQAQATGPTIRYMKETSYTNAADMVLEGDDKPEATFVLEEVDVAVRKVAVHTKVTDETLEDFAQIRPYVDQKLAFMLRSKIDDQLLNGTGTAPQLAGLLGTSGVQTAEMASNTALEFAKTVMNAITKVRSVGFFSPDTIVMHPNDYEKLRLAVDGNSQFYGGGFFQGQYGVPYNDPNFLWGVRVVQTTAIAELNLATPGASNKGPIIGDFKNGGMVFYRNGVSVESTNTDQDDFIMNLTTIRVEQRLALAVPSPLAFCRVINAS